ncbi:MAG: hypothetical protein AAGG07_10855 [Planctomycetota bacterium]
MADLSSINAGQEITCTVTSEPTNKGARHTIARLMRRDPENAKALRNAQVMRERRKNRYIRGNRVWVAREKAAKVVRVAPGASWKMAFTHDLAAEIKSVERFVSIETK